MSCLYGYLRCASITLRTKSEKFCNSIFHGTWKTLFEDHLWPFWPKYPRTRFFQKRYSPAAFSIGWYHNVMQKIQKLLLVFLEKNSREADKRTESISLDFHFVSRTQKLTRNKGNKQKNALCGISPDGFIIFCAIHQLVWL